MTAGPDRRGDFKAGNLVPFSAAAHHCTAWRDGKLIANIHIYTYFNVSASRLKRRASPLNQRLSGLMRHSGDPLRFRSPPSSQRWAPLPPRHA